ncbi:MAG: AbrB/MazE/SpoVT family DNA-binding domain-containing protein [Chloroflexi bacterium]|nr:AbrB/MazE/SpoVT family DNA-binding domain-containing protein [Chloroflexota bacterium]
MPVVFKRRLMTMGAGSLVITVPKCWAEFYQLRAGDSVQVIVADDLRVLPAPRGTRPAESEPAPAA